MPSRKSADTRRAKPKAKGTPHAGNRRKPGSKRQVGVVLLAGGNPQIAKADGDAPVQAYIAALRGWKSDLGKRIDSLIVRTVPSVRKAVRWNSPFYGKGARWIDIRENDELDEAQMATWVKQAASVPGWVP
jgi:hypothetical protein